MNSQTLLKQLVTIALCLAFIVVTVGAYTRLVDAGLGCPDWPGCYGKLILPSESDARIAAQSNFPDRPIVADKAWTEMAHRYIASTLGLLIVSIAALALWMRHRTRILATSLVGLVIFQGVLGMWTVTWKLLPTVVMSHLLGGVTIFSLLFLLRQRLQPKANLAHKACQQKIVCMVAGITFLQIALGGWVSSNYAGLACIGFPSCNGFWVPQLDFAQAFSFFHPIGVNYEGGVLNSPARMTIQFVHRLGAVITWLSVMGVGLWGVIRGSRQVKLIAAVAMVLVSVQFTLGVANIVTLLHLPIAVMHNGVALLLLASLIKYQDAVS